MNGTRRAAALAQARQLLADNPAAALAALRPLTRTDPPDADAWRLAGRALRALGRVAEAEQAELAAIDAAAHDPELQRAALALADNRLGEAEPRLKARLKAIPTDVAAIRMLAELAGRIGRHRDAENLLRRALELAPAFHAARSNLATVLHRQNRTPEALAELDTLIAAEPEHLGHANLRAAALTKVGEFDEALTLYETVLEKPPGHPRIWMSYGHALKTVGRSEDSVAAYRKAIALQPSLGEVWWSLANLKTVRFAQADVVAMRAALTGADLAEEDRFHLHFALAKALEDAGESDDAFDNYLVANRLRRADLPYDAMETSRAVDRTIALFTPEFVSSLTDGCAAPDPIFIVGLPRSGSTLIEQILACHSQVEGTMELPDIPAMVSRLASDERGFSAKLAALSADERRALGEEFLARTRIQRKSHKPFFIDKLPNNWAHVGFIKAILPDAKIVDARRHPLDCGVSNFRQHFARGQAFSYDLADIGTYYSDYVRLMAHFDVVMPGAVTRVFHEALVADPEAEVRALLAALGLDFEDDCLRFHENTRAVRTASSEQVRRPVNRDGLGQWRRYDAHLGPLREALGRVLTDYAIPT
ncbi:sulfotransferase [Novosphingobium sp. Gsoil 351]|uniref:tetratricopeptide repeat-containing sulfotransferase family protein n=1 Tax=Novosphingobium sp. Gsoil 351 TaxID=2675225 RepID=UPI0012B4BF2F|nr:sulfotransferase [Novosphingobium sp. Gsoil 351]QGN53649.1 tetratricopeptide repeat protein [Novosphingobium sp. Gsoil 351]